MEDDAPVLAPARSTTGKPAWYAEQEMALRDYLKGKVLHNKIVENRAKFLVQEGKAKSIEEATKIALADIGDSIPSATPTASVKPAAKRISASEKALRGRKS